MSGLVLAGYYGDVAIIPVLLAFALGYCILTVAFAIGWRRRLPGRTIATHRAWGCRRNVAVRIGSTELVP